jgi:uncharacterized protein YndB with AHSA1/START domain
VPAFTLTADTRADLEDVWKLLFDPSRFPEWWAGVEAVRVDSPGAYTMWPDGYPDFPMPQHLRTDRAASRITVSCQVSDIDITWQLAEAAGRTAISVRVELPPTEAHRLPAQRELITASLDALVNLAAAPP